MRSSLRAYRFARKAKFLNSCDHNRFFDHFKQLILPSNNSIKLRINDIETDDSVFVSDTGTLNNSFASDFSSNIHTPPDIIANQIPLFIGLSLSLANVCRALMHTKSSKSSPDNVPGLFLSKLAFPLTYPVQRIVVSSLSNSSLPVAWKLTHIISIFLGQRLTIRC